MKTSKYEIKLKMGIDDLKGLYAFVGNEQEGIGGTNSIEEYKASQGWLSFAFDCPMTPEAIAKEIQERKEWNRHHITELRAQGRFGEEYITTLELVHNPIYDDGENFKESPLSSFKMVFLDADNKLHEYE